MESDNHTQLNTFELTLLEHARKASDNAYAPYSKFRVGAAVEADDGRIFVGANVENVSYGLTICAERSAITCAVTAGARTLKAIAVYSPHSHSAIIPCGACLQVMAEFSDDDCILILAGTSDAPRRTSLKALFPEAFSQ